MKADQLLGAHWQPVPMTWHWTKVKSPQGTVHVLLTETPLGRHGFAFTAEDLDVFIKTAQEAKSGLTLPANGLVTP